MYLSLMMLILTSYLPPAQELLQKLGKADWLYDSELRTRGWMYLAPLVLSAVFLTFLCSVTVTHVLA